LPLSLVNGLLRLTAWDEAAVIKVLILGAFGCFMLLLATRKLSVYNE
jgi:hypothetical protein